MSYNNSNDTIVACVNHAEYLVLLELEIKFMCKTGNELGNCVIMSISHSIHVGVALSVHLLVCLFSRVQVSTDIKKKKNLVSPRLFSPNQTSELLQNGKEVILIHIMLLFFK